MNNNNLSNIKIIDVMDNDGNVELIFNSEFKSLYVKKNITPDFVPIYEKIQQLDSNYFPVIYDIVTNNNSATVLEEFISGVTLADMVNQTDVIDLTTAISYMKEITSSIELLHQNNIIHGNLNENNVVLTDSGKIKIIDSCTSHHVSDKTMNIYVMSTEGNKAQEQFGFIRNDQKTDIYSLGILFNFILTGATSPGNYKENTRMADIIKKCTFPDPAKRYTSCSEILIDLDNVSTSDYILTNVIKILSITLFAAAILIDILYIIFICSTSRITSVNFYTLFLLNVFCSSPFAVFGNWFDWQQHTPLAGKSQFQKYIICTIICLIIWFALIFLFGF